MRPPPWLRDRQAVPLAVVSESSHPGPATLCHVLREDPELAEAIPDARRRQAIDECTATELYLPAGRTPRGAGNQIGAGLGMLVLEGLLIRRVGIDGRFGAELLGEGDLLRPSQGEFDSPLLPLETGWIVPEPARLAVLDEEFVQRLARYPELAPAIVARAMQRARNLAVNMAIVHQARVDVRLQMLLWHLAGRWGRVRSDATVVPLRLTHTLLADLVAARRPTVTTALTDLARRGLVASRGDEWLLFGEAPVELLDVEGRARHRPSETPRLASTS
jgi:CRP/FNR family transcriptional regulator, cyclic AMP receptor protein